MIVIDERDTTKTCTICGHLKEDFPLSERIYQCDVCGTVLDRDQNAAINIMKWFLSHNTLWTGYQYFLISIANLQYTTNRKMKIPCYYCDDRFSGLAGSPLS